MLALARNCIGYGAADLGRRPQAQEMLSARLGDVALELYLPVRRAQALGMMKGAMRKTCDRQFCMESGFATIETSLDESVSQLSQPFAAALLRFVQLAFRSERRGPLDALTKNG